MSKPKKIRRKIKSRVSHRTRIGKEAYEAYKKARGAQKKNGVTDLSQELRTYAKELLETVAKAATPGVEKIAKEEAPVRTGALRDSIVVAPMRDGRVIVRARVWYSNMVPGAVDHDYTPAIEAAVESVT